MNNPGYDIVTTTSPTFNIVGSAELELEGQPELPVLPLLIVRADKELTRLRAQR
ncbi:hypothetical protein D3C83_269980 [compost metagenome]